VVSALAKKLADKKFAFRDITLCLDGTLSRQREELMAELFAATRSAEDAPNPDARLSSVSPAKALQKRIDALEDEMRDSSITIRLTAVNFGEYNKFIIQNPPRKGNTQDAQLGLNGSTFFMDVARRTAKFLNEDGELEDIADDEWEQLEETLTDGEFDRIANAVLDLNRREGQRGVDFLSRGSKTTRDSDETPASLETSASHPASSGGGSESNARRTRTTKRAD
jgi:hypothetical protein